MRASGSRNAMWRGGRSIASNGYVLIRVGTDHHLSDVRGYAYEHRLVAEKAIRRKLKPGELVHHKNGDRQDNRRKNLEVVASQAEHLLRHRKADSRRRLPNQANPDIECACGCGGRFSAFDACGRPRRFIWGHNARTQGRSAP